MLQRLGVDEPQPATGATTGISDPGYNELAANNDGRFPALTFQR